MENMKKFNETGELMGKLDLYKMQEIQKELQDKYKDKWGGLSVKKGKEQLLWMLIEAGEVADIIKKDGDDKIMNDKSVRVHFIEELCDVLMYLNDVMLCFDIKPKEVEEIYLKKHHTNMNRW